MKLGIPVSHVSKGGGEKIQQFLINSFIDKGHYVFIYTWQKSNVKLLKGNNRKIILLSKRANSFSQLFINAIEIFQSIRKNNIDVFLTFGINEAFLLPILFSKAKLVVSLRVDPSFPPNKYLLKIRRLIFFSLSDAIVFQTEKVKKMFPRNIQSKSLVISNPVIQKIKVVKLNYRKKQIVAVGRLSKEKNFEILIKAFRNINPGNYTLHIYGDGDQYDFLNSLILKLKLDNRVFLEGKITDIVNVIKWSEIFVLPSSYEGMPNALIEAMSMGLACISTNFPSGAAEFLINNEQNGLLIPVNDQNRLEKALSKLITDEKFRIKVSENAKKLNKLLDKDKIINQWIKILSFKKKQNENIKEII